jgi:hypothetical protein
MAEAAEAAGMEALVAVVIQKTVAWRRFIILRKLYT